MLDGFTPYLTAGGTKGCTNAAQLHAELQAQGWCGSLRPVQGYLRPFRARPAAPAAPTPKPRHVVTWIMSDPDRLDPTTRPAQGGPDPRPRVGGRRRPGREFAKLLTHRRGHRLEAWITATTADSDPHLAGFAVGLRRDQAAGTAGLTSLQQRRRRRRREPRQHDQAAAVRPGGL